MKLYTDTHTGNICSQLFISEPGKETQGEEGGSGFMVPFGESADTDICVTVTCYISSVKEVCLVM